MALSEIAPGLSHLAVWRIGGGSRSARSTTFLFLLLATACCPTPSSRRARCSPGTIVSTVLLQLTFEPLPLYVRSVEGLPMLKIFGGAAVLLVWLYLMGNVLLIGGAITWWAARGRAAAAATAAVAQVPESASV